MTGLAVFILATGISVICAAGYLCWLRFYFCGMRWSDTVKPGLALALSVGAYVGMCLWLGFGWWPQLLGAAASMAVAWGGSDWLPIPHLPQRKETPR